MKSRPGSLGNYAYVIAGLSFVPLLGIVFGLVAVGIGLRTDKRDGRKVASIGAAGTALSVLLYGGLYVFGFMQRGEIYDDLRAKLAHSSLNSLADAVEAYKLRFGVYPESLQSLKAGLPEDSLVIISDPTDGAMQRNFFYRRVDAGHYLLRGVGPDGIPFTADDLIPAAGPTVRLGLLVDSPDDR